jgi:Sec-independent protein translocase protein TatA
MFGLGVWEIAMICIVVLVFVRPEELPRVMRKLGTLYGRVTGSSRRIMRQLQFPPELDDDPQQGDPGHSIAPPDGNETAESAGIAVRDSERGVETGSDDRGARKEA